MAPPTTLPNRQAEWASTPGEKVSLDWRVLSAILLVAAIGLWWMLGPQAQILWSLWTSNGLDSIGALIPVASIVLAYRAWRGKQWKKGGTWWGLVLCAAVLLLVWLMKEQGAPLLAYQRIGLHLLPIGLLVFLYLSGVVLLFGGYEAYRAAFFPIFLMLFLNPAPNFFTHFIDLPLQYAGAHTARAFAQLIGVPLAVDDLRLMFSPALGMFIAPGCNGLRGAVAMGLMTMIAGHLYGLPLRPRGIYVVSGVVLAYLLNLVRLCGLVLCYKAALGFGLLARHMEAADYFLGSMVFFSGAIFVFVVPRKWKIFKQSASLYRSRL
ncbi:exosortase J [Acidobacterium sp. S8]|uniref:exosortase J n=1 Tax=Acidobacterium sp. S8 TaxID=1641854 RepID=UPI00131AC139|nr:exosortase J [Acidobacterium sp. S8]